MARRAWARRGRRPGMKIGRPVTEWLLPALACPCCGTVVTAHAPPGLHPGTNSYGLRVNTAVLLSGYGTCPPSAGHTRWNSWAKPIAATPDKPTAACRARCGYITSSLASSLPNLIHGM